MKHNILYIILIALAVSSCKKVEISKYEAEADNIYFHYLDRYGERDTATISYSFATSPGLLQDTIWVSLSVAGKRVSHDRQFVIGLVDSLTDAVPGLHYEALKPSYTMPADSGKIKIPLVIKNTDPELGEKSVRIALKVVEGADFKAELPEIIKVKKFVFSNRLEQPSWWMYWQGNLGPYSRTTHRLFLISGGQDLTNPAAPDGYLGIPRTLYYIENAKNFTRDPNTWILRNPDKGYVLAKREDGTQDYDFYQPAAPLIKIHYKYFEQVNGYFFINERGNQIIIN